MRTFYPGAVLLLLAACGRITQPSDTLAGSWLNADARLVATRKAMVFARPCTAAWFPPVALDVDGSFVAVSDSVRTMTITGPTSGAPLYIAGSLEGTVLRLEYYDLHRDPPTLPAVFEATLVSGTTETPLNCTT